MHLLLLAAVVAVADWVVSFATRAGDMLAFNTGSVSLYQLVGILISVIIPIAVDLVTQRLAAPRVKSLVLAGLTALNGFLLEFVQSVDSNTAFHLEQALLNVLVGFVIATATLFGLWRPTGVSGSTGAVATRVPGGVGQPRAA